MYTLLVGTKKNVGDFLIVHRCKELLKEHAGMGEYLEYKRWLPLDDELDKINNTKAVILCGGPGYSSDFHPNIFRLADDLKKIEVPIIPMGLGWFGKANMTPETFKFSDSSMKAIKHIHESCETSSVRDVITQSVLNNHGMENVMMTGCPAWYDINKMGTKFSIEEPKRIVVSGCQNKKFYPQNVKLMKAVKKAYPDAEHVYSFHRGIGSDSETSAVESMFLKRMAKQAKNLDFIVEDVSYDISDMVDLYSKCDLHVGYRVHGHIFFLSQRKPSFLLHEDWRGRGLSKSLGTTRDIVAWEGDPIAGISQSLSNLMNYGPEYFDKIGSTMEQTYKDSMLKFLDTIP